MAFRGSSVALARDDFDIGADMDPGVGGRFEDPSTNTEQRWRSFGRKLIKIRPSDFVTRFIRVKDSNSGQIIKVDFSERRYLLRPYNTGAKRMLFMTSRQTEKSTTLGNKLLQRSVMRRHGAALFVTPSAMQTTDFSKARVAGIIDISPLIKGMTSSKLTNNILEKEFISGSKIYLRYAYLTADRIRGLSVNDVFVDEIQDLLSQNMPVIEETASHVDNPFFCYSGTPKTFDNTIENYWSKASTQSEWVIPCEAHGTPKNPGSWHWNVLGEKNLGKYGPICDECGKILNPEHPMAQWVAMNPGASTEGFRICRLMVPWFAKNPDKWKDIIEAYELYPRAQFFNEVLALSYDSGTKPITRSEVIRACDSKYLNTEEQAAKLSETYPTYAGIDWGCYDDKTRTLTEHGFKYHWEISERDRIAQYEPSTGDISYVVPKKKIVFDHEGDMIRFKTKNVDMLVTPDHKMMYRTGSRSTSPWKECEAQDLIGKDNVRFKQIGKWFGAHQPFFRIAGHDVPMDRWLRFLGLVISEGFIGLSGTYRELSISQRYKEGHKVAYIERVLSELPFPVRFRCVNKKTNDLVWTICGSNKDELWNWFTTHVGQGSGNKRIPREFLELPGEQLEWLLESLMVGDGSWDHRDGSRGTYSSTSPQLGDDVQELLSKLERRSCKGLRPAEGNKKAKHVISFSRNKEFVLHTRNGGISRVPYRGKAYCFSVPSGYFITERNGRIAQQGNTGENTYTVLSVVCYPRNDTSLQVIYTKRFDGRLTDPDLQMAEIKRLLVLFRCRLIGTDYGQGFVQNHTLVTIFGNRRVHKFQYAARAAAKYGFSQKLKRYIVFRTPVMADIFGALKRKKIRLPRWKAIEHPHGDDILAIFQEYSETQKMLRYDTPKGVPDDTLHAILYAALVSMIEIKRPDIIDPQMERKRKDNLAGTVAIEALDGHF